MGKAPRDLPVLAFKSQQAFDAWLASQPSSCRGLWLKVAKKSSGIASISRDEAVDAALCHGWIDGQLQRYDERHWLIRFTPRSAKSKWSKQNQLRAEELIANGRMRPGGLDEVNRARLDGRWQSAYPSQRTATVPAGLQHALDANPAAKRFFASLDSANRYAILYRLHHTVKAEARAAKIEKFVDMLARGETIHPRKTSKPDRK